MLLCKLVSKRDFDRHKKVVRPHATIKNSMAKKVVETLIEKIRRVDEPISDFQQFLVDWKRLLNVEISWKCIERPKVSLILHRWVCEELVDRDVNQPSGGGWHCHTCPRRIVLSMAVCQISWSCLSRAYYPWSHDCSNLFYMLSC